MFLVPVSRSARGLDRFFDEALDRFFLDGTRPSSQAPAAARAPALDVTESDAAYTVVLDMPGVTREDIQVSIENRKVTVSAQPAEAPVAEGASAVPPEADRATERVVYRERQPLTYARSFTLAAEIDQDQSQARYEQGVLTLTLVKRRPATSRLTIN
jgi:HSP20 family protein